MAFKKTSTASPIFSEEKVVTRPNPRALSVSDAARCLGVGRTLFYELLVSGEIASVHIGRRRLILTSEIDRFLAAKMPMSGMPEKVGGGS